MCMADGDTCDAVSESEPIARKEHRCDECYRTIKPGEKYTRIGAVADGSATTYKQCAHCQIPINWLVQHCHGYIFTGVFEDIHEHVEAFSSLKNKKLAWEMARIAVCMRRKWASFKDPSVLMPLPMAISDPPPPPKPERHYSTMDDGWM